MKFQSIKQPFLIGTKTPLKRLERRFFFELSSSLYIVVTFRILWIISYLLRSSVGFWGDGVLTQY